MIAEMIAMTSLTCIPAASRAASKTADYITDSFAYSCAQLRSSVFLGLKAIGVQDELQNIAEQCREENWDGYGAAPVTAETCYQACRFMDSLPFNIPPPTVGAEPDGHLTLEWYQSPLRTLSISISPDGELYYAALLGAGKQFGSEPFFGEPPANIINLINRISVA